MYCEDDDLGAIDMHARQQRGFLVTADGHRVAPVGGVVEQPAEEHEAGDGDQNRHRHAVDLAIAEDEEVFVGNTDGLAVGEDIGQPAHDLHGRQCRNQRIDTQLGDDDAVDKANHQPQRQSCRHTEKHAVGVANDDTGDDPGAGQHRAHRQVEVPGRQAEQHGAGGNAHGRNRQAKTAHVQR
ncbi:hypersensitivity response secretion protein hrpJ [Pseudomonas syringae pv. spinaceae]|uniref:Hypersensitivity response secretion protein hrpJ n=1 Tax=Pseudomonas syringae pv. spinaceae TaxID=264459 RepID=A0A0Q0AVE8_PSESX|nr:hypersensitivity response secretion protein hrpJ [Pseudomonas syringae pv. spinaceae]